MINDEYIINRFWPNKIYLFNRVSSPTNEELEYITNRFKKSESIYETIFCIKHNIDRDNVKCPICGIGDVKFRGDKKRGIFLNGCCQECQLKYRNIHSQQTSLERYGTKHPRKNKEKNNEINNLQKQTNIKKYGVEYYTQSGEYKERYKNTCLTKYGVDHVFKSEEIKEKIHNTCKEKYGTDWTFQNDLAKQHQKETLLKKYGVENSYCIPFVIESFNERKNEIQQKRDNTKRKNSTFGASIPEQKTYKLLLKYFNDNDIIRQYKDKRYPFNCDFYIKSKDIFIECNYFWTHQHHFFDETNEKDINTLSNLIEKSKTKKFYLDAITTWTKRDIEKRNYAIKSKLNYVVFWDFSEAINWLNEYEKNN